jgi:dolichyl-phosphate-mannose-protein mannosyltransferase
VNSPATLESLLAVVMAVVLVAFALHGLTIRLRTITPQSALSPPWTLAVVGTLLFLLVRPGVPGVIRSFLWWMPATMAIAGAAGWIGTAFVHARATQPTNRGDRRRQATIVVALSCALALPAAVIPAARGWDLSGWMDSHSYDVFALNIATGKVPLGSSDYMPVYQYGLAFVDVVFGHFFFVQQIINVALAISATAAIATTAWLLFDSAPAAALAGVWAAFTPQFYQSIHLTQIENWYVPFVCLVLLAYALYWRRPTMWRAAGLAAAVSLGVNTRNQGALFFALMASAPLFASEVPWRERLAHTVLIATLVAVSLVPWTLRNYVVEGRLSPSASRTAFYVGVLNDPRVGFYGLRYWDGIDAVLADYERRFPDPLARQRAYFRSAWTHLSSEPRWLVRAIFWRTLGFYGLLPPGTIELAAVRPTNWVVEWKSFVLYRATFLLIIPLSCAALALRPTRPGVVLAAAVVAMLAIVVVAASPEDRISYPTLPAHILLIAGLVANGTAPQRHAASPSPGVPRRWTRFASSAAVVAVALGVCYAAVGSRFLYRPLIERRVIVDPAVRVGSDAALLDVRGPLAAGDLVRARCMITNYMAPPKSVGRVPGVPAFASDPSRETYYFTYQLTGEPRPRIAATIGVTFQGAVLSEPLREGDAVDIEGEVVWFDSGASPPLWLQARRVRKLPIAASDLPPFAS